MQTMVMPQIYEEMNLLRARRDVKPSDDWQAWDAQIEQDSSAGKLDFLAAKAVRAGSRPI